MQEESTIYEEDNINTSKNIFRPFLKWVGGKTQIISTIISDFPREVNNYHELFLGGGSVLFAFLSCVKNNSIKLHGKVFAYDANSSLIYLYKAIQSRPLDLYNNVIELVNLYYTLSSSDDESSSNIDLKKPNNYEEALRCKESYYYWIRKEYNDLSEDEKQSIRGSSLFLFLNKTCFRGLFRLGPKGFNVPFGNYKNPEVINKDHLMLIHNILIDVVFEVKDFKESIKNIRADDFVYLDPPYVPENTKSFVNYTRCGFSLEDHEYLFASTKKLENLNVKVMMSNSDVDLVNESFNNPDFNFHIKSIICKRTINSKKPSSKTNEVIIKNY